MNIKSFNEFITEELKKVLSDASGSGRTKSFDIIHDDEPYSDKSISSGILLRDRLKKQEFKDLIALAGKSLPEYVIKDYLRNPTKAKGAEKILVTMNNLKFLKDMEKRSDLYCAYCNKGPLIIYDINPGKKLKISNKNYRYTQFNPKDGATCDHKMPQSKGGDKFNYSNLAVCCSKCNKDKGNMSYDSWMKIVNSRKLYEGNEFTKLATHFMDDMDSKFKFTEPSDPAPLRFCDVTFPDGMTIRFNPFVNMNSDTETVTLRPLTVDSLYSFDKRSDINLSTSYLNLYGRSFQFDNFLSFKRIRYYMWKDDLFDTEFDGYIYNRDKLGFIEVTISFTEANHMTSTNTVNPSRGNLFTKGIHQSRIEMIINAASKIGDEYLTKFKNSDSRYDLLHSFIDELDEKGSELISVFEWRNLIGYLYLYYILVEPLEEIADILRNKTKISAHELIYILYSMN